MIQGITISLIKKTIDSYDSFNNPVFKETKTNVSNVLVAPSNVDDVTSSVNLYGKEAKYVIAIPKGDTNTWTDNDVEFFGERWHVFSLPMQGIEANIPLSWNAKYYVERYE